MTLHLSFAGATEYIFEDSTDEDDLQFLEERCTISSDVWANCDESEEEETEHEEIVNDDEDRRHFLVSSREVLHQRQRDNGEPNLRESSRWLIETIPINQLPDELKVYIATFCDVPSIGRLAKTNKEWHNLMGTPYLWFILCGRDFGAASAVTPASANSPLWKKMYQEYSTPLELDDRFRMCHYGQIGEKQAAEYLKEKEP
ncbi:hypothetical protein PROFUN_10724, partial [Planoprotostelium fungivorum]